MSQATIHRIERPLASAMSPRATAEPPADTHKPQRGWILATLCLAQLMISLDVLIVNIALPSAQRSLGFGIADRQWTVTAYALAFGSLLLLGGRLSDLFGRKRMFVLGLVGFGVASAAGGAATSFVVLVIARAVQGAFAAVLSTGRACAVDHHLHRRQESRPCLRRLRRTRGRGSRRRPAARGVLVQYLNWRWCMFVNVGFVAAALVGAGLFLSADNAPTRPTLDLPGIALVTAGLFGLVYGFSHASSRRLVEHHHARLRRWWRRSARGFHISANAGVEPAPAAARGARPQPCRRLSGDLYGRTRPVRDVALCHLLLPADPRLHRDPVRPCLLALARRVHDHVPNRQPGDRETGRDCDGRLRPASQSQASR